MGAPGPMVRRPHPNTLQTSIKVVLCESRE